MMNLLALGLVFTTLLTAELYSPTASNDDVIVKEGHRVVVVEYDRDGKSNTRVLISPPSEGEEVEGERGSSLFQKAKETVSYLPNVGQGISQPEDEEARDQHVTRGEETEEEARDHHVTAGEVICDAFGKCRRKIASVVGRAKDKTVGEMNPGDAATEAKETVARTARDVEDTVAEKAKDTKETMAHKAQEAKETMGRKAHDMKETVTHKAQEAKESMGHKAHNVKETVAHKAHEAKNTAQEKAREKAQKLKKTTAQKSQNAWERIKTVAGGFASAISTVLSPTKVASIIGVTAIAAAFGTSVWVTFVSSYVLASVLGRQQFGIVQSKLYPVYFKAISVGILVGLLGHVLSCRRKLLTEASEMWQGVNLLASFFMIEANKSFVEPRATKAMFERMKAEKEEGRGGGSGGERTSEQEVRRKLEKLSERLSKLNTYSSWLNILALMSLTWHFVYLGQRLGAAC